MYLSLSIFLFLFFFLDPESLSDADRRSKRLDLLSDYHNYDYDNRGCETEYPNMRPLITIADYIAYADDYPNFCGDVRVLVCVGFVVFDSHLWAYCCVLYLTPIIVIIIVTVFRERVKSVGPSVCITK